jgi:hypothetical protein
MPLQRRLGADCGRIRFLCCVPMLYFSGNDLATNVTNLMKNVLWGADPGLRAGIQLLAEVECGVEEVWDAIRKIAQQTGR